VISRGHAEHLLGLLRQRVIYVVVKVLQVYLAVIVFSFLLHRMQVSLLAFISVKYLLFAYWYALKCCTCNNDREIVMLLRLLRGLRRRPHEVEIVVPYLHFNKVFWPLWPF
jgi:hypothetical protein